ncbi:MAG: hypothetical protein MnENMB40S_12150 [Rhizobiaceae bacterium MnEN-MB40S]|nr:MAG: hypothetical protein MnENMB40S_12150 [Rhizobiaceae bacterium MnEN-MB40S]
MKMKHKNLITSSAMMLFIAATGTANAFDEVNWVWNADVATTVTTAASSITDVTPTGLNQAENEQQTLGALTSTGNVTAVDNALISGLTGAAPITDLAAVETSASALGNSASIESDVQVSYDSIQTFGGVDVALAAPLVGDIADLSLPGTVTSSSSAIGILNASVDSSATGVANNLTVNLETTSDQDAFGIGNNEQTALAIVSSTSLVDAVSFGGFADLGTLDNAVVKSVSTAVGNNFGVTIDGIN